jgi:thiamine-phosphate pyrophosphorylase
MPPSVPINESTLLFITDSNRSKQRSSIEIVRSALEGGCKWVQYRAPELSDSDFYTEALKIRELCASAAAGLIVNDRLDVAALIRANGVHLGSNDLPLRVVKEYAGDDFLVGYSAHSLQEAITAAWEGADYITFSPIFPFEHKESPYKPHGLDGAKEVLSKIKVPIFFLGGIRFPDLKNLAKALHPLRIASVSMISEADDVTQTVEEILAVLGEQG